jgi:hypothetical protein
MCVRDASRDACAGLLRPAERTTPKPLIGSKARTLRRQSFHVFELTSRFEGIKRHQQALLELTETVHSPNLLLSERHADCDAVSSPCTQTG